MLYNQLEDKQQFHRLVDQIGRKLLVRGSPRYRQYHHYKGKDANGVNLYRVRLAPSPTTAVAEAMALELLSKCPELRDRKHVYSYRWPTSRISGRPYSYFLKGYRERNAAVSQALREHSKTVVVFMDVADFYPSIDIDQALSLLQSVLSKEKPHVSSFVWQVVHGATQAAGGNIPQGTPVGHVLANLFMSGLDSKMADKFGPNQTRYVDDFTVVCPADEVNGTLSTVRSWLGEIGLRLNEDKTQVIGKENWTGFSDNPQRDQFSRTFTKIAWAIQIYCLRFPGNINNLRHDLRKAGVGLPVQTARTNSQYPRLQAFLLASARRYGGVRMLLSDTQERLSSQIISGAQHLQSEVANLIYQQLEIPSDRSIVDRKRRLLALRFFLSRAIYLLRPHQLNTAFPLGSEPDLSSFSMLFQCLEQRDATQLLDFPGPTTQAAASIARENDLRFTTSIGALHRSDPSIDSLGTLLAYQVMEEPGRLAELAPRNEPHAASFLSFCAGNRAPERTLADLSYEDELESLRLGVSSEALGEFWDIRFSDRSPIPLDALGLANYSLS